jgi:hypothetical protein
MHIFCHIWLTLSILPWNENWLLLGWPLLTTEYQTIIKSISTAGLKKTDIYHLETYHCSHEDTTCTFLCREVVCIYCQSLIRIANGSFENIAILSFGIHLNGMGAGIFRFSRHRVVKGKVFMLNVNKMHPAIQVVESHVCARAHTDKQTVFQKTFFLLKGSQIYKSIKIFSSFFH